MARDKQITTGHNDTQETIALLAILELGNRQIEEGRVHTIEYVFERIRERRRNPQ